MRFAHAANARNGEDRMNAYVEKTLLTLCALAMMCLAVHTAMAQTPTSRIVSAANNFLSTLDQTQRRNVLFAFDDEQQRARWSNLPITIVRRAGLSMGELNAAQRSAAMALLASALSRRGFEKVQQIMDADELLKKSEGKADVRQGSLLHLHPGNAFRESAVDVAVRRTPSRAQHHHCGRTWRSHAEPHRRPAGLVHRQRHDDPAPGPGERQGVRLAECARRRPAQAGDPQLPGRRPRARPRPGRQDDPAGRAARLPR